MLEFAKQADANLAAGKESPTLGEKPAATTTPPASGNAAPAPGKDGQPAAKGDAKPAEGSDKKPVADGSQPAPGKDGKEGKEGSAYAKAKAEEARQKEVLAGFQKEKDAFHAERDAFRAQQQGLTTEVTNLRRQVAELRKQSAGPAKDKLGLTADDYDGLANKYKAEGRSDLQEAAEDKAAELRKQTAAIASQPAATDFSSPEFQSEWQANVQSLIQKDPELGKPDNPVVRAANLLVNDQKYGRFFRSHPSGIAAAVEVAQIMQGAEKAKTLQTELEAKDKELTAAKAEIERLTKLTQPQGSHPASPAPADKKPEDMSDDEIMAVARAADAGRT